MRKHEAGEHVLLCTTSVLITGNRSVLTIVFIRGWLTVFPVALLMLRAVFLVFLFFTFSARAFEVIDDLSVFHITKLFHASVGRAYAAQI